MILVDALRNRVQERAADADLMFPVYFGARGSAQIGVGAALLAQLVDARVVQVHGVREWGGEDVFLVEL